MWLAFLWLRHITVFLTPVHGPHHRAYPSALPRHGASSLFHLPPRSPPPMSASLFVPNLETVRPSLPLTFQKLPSRRVRVRVGRGGGRPGAERARHESHQALCRFDLCSSPPPFLPSSFPSSFPFHRRGSTVEQGVGGGRGGGRSACPPSVLGSGAAVFVCDALFCPAALNFSSLQRQTTFPGHAGGRKGGRERGSERGRNGGAGGTAPFEWMGGAAFPSDGGLHFSPSLPSSLSPSFPSFPFSVRCPGGTRAGKAGIDRGREGGRSAKEGIGCSS
ncbi:hypothetical protein NGA_0377000 [Nannochloropsis gaditana CCMP526]|uniref:uncharacterized protein n=1 Tax=Nannochloropsis gaditana (strain CCMP526) TaxID=1093141 RepID=UPI00029F6116|nr:hypothetical protein NGA_0377000 [Nannochloropsis gaditana CCMP526]EKU21531.1 hypothetical protein NGA_0377000 [Nannochloropsis gaditana CCMP526]|eukprot:XP_005854829.1 hypothetical protein NGA_0377000 [Nannochloropsis gaditana CCMP526]